MEYKYYRELKHNYLIFENRTNNEEEDRYQYKIAQSGRIKNLVPCAERNINGEKYIYYEIGSMQSLKDRFAVSKIDHRQLRGLLESIKELLENLSEFLMGEEGLVFNAKSIYTDLSTGEYKLIFCPFFDEEKNFSEFAMELLELVDENDEKAMNMAYGLCEQSSGSGDLIYEAIEKVLEDEGLEQKEGALPVIEHRAAPHKNEEPVFREGEDDFQDDDGSFDEEEKEPERGGRLRRANRRLGGKLQLLFSLLFLCVLGGMVYIRMNFLLSSQENMLSILVMIVCAVTAGVSFAGGLKELKNTGSDSFEYEEEPSQEEDDFGEFEDFCREEDHPMVEAISSYRKPLKGSGSLPTERTEFEYGETVVLDEQVNEEMALFSRNLDKTVRIALGSLPLTIGKMEGCVDRVLNDKSVSRIHCRFEKEGDRVFIRDLGSTNGSFRNGVRLKAQEKTYIEEGDEIRIGRVCFDCR